MFEYLPSIFYSWRTLSWLGFLLFLCTIFFSLPYCLKFLCDSSPAEGKNKFDTKIIFALLLLSILGTSEFFKSPDSIAELHISDSAEYVLAARQIVTHDEYRLNFPDEKLPPRYPPWFSSFMLVPSMSLAAGEPGVASYPTLGFALLGLFCTALLGFKMGGIWGFVICGLLGVSIPGLRYFAGQVMTDVPSASLSAFLLLLYLCISSQTRSNSLPFLYAGLLIAFATSFRATGIFLALPFVYYLSKHRKQEHLVLFKLLSLLAPGAFMGLLTLFYNQATFGSFFRNGYHYWVSIPYDFFAQTFSLTFLGINAEVLLNHTGIIPLLLLALVYPFISKWCQKNGWNVPAPIPKIPTTLIFIGWVGVPTLLFYSFYFYSTPRFYLPLALLLSVPAGLVLVSLPQIKGWSDSVALYTLAFFCALSIIVRVSREPDRLPKQEAIRRVNQVVPEYSTIISGLDPLYAWNFLEITAPGNQFTFLPISRRIEYASKVLTAKKPSVVIPIPDSPEHMRRLLLRSGSREAIRRVALEDMEGLEEELRSRKRIFVEASLLLPEELDEFKKRFLFIERGTQINELALLEEAKPER